MGFEIVEPGTFLREPIGEGTCSIHRNGTVTFCAADLKLVGMDLYALVLADPGLLRIGLRKPRTADERKQSRALTPRSGRNGQSGHVSIQLGAAIRRLGLKPEAVAGRYDLITKDDLLILPLASGEPRGKQVVEAALK